MTDFRALCIELLCSLEQYPVQPPRDRDLIDRARAARRPKPPSLKEQALKALDDISFASFELDAKTPSAAH